MNWIISKRIILEWDETPMIILSNLFFSIWVNMGLERENDYNDLPGMPELPFEPQILISTSVVFVIFQPNVIKLPLYGIMLKWKNTSLSKLFPETILTY